MNTTILTLLLTLPLLAVPMFILSMYEVKLMNKLMKQLFVLLISLAGMAATVIVAVKVDRWWCSLMLVLLMLLFSTMILVRKTRGGQRMILPMLAGLLVGCGVVELYTFLAVLGLGCENALKALVPFMGLLLVLVIPVQKRALKAFLSGIMHHSQLYYYLMTNGATPEQSSDYFFRRSMKMAMIEYSGRLSALMVGSAPVLFWTLTLVGTDAVTAALLQFVLLAAMLCACVLSVWVTLVSGRRFMSDKYGNLKK